MALVQASTITQNTGDQPGGGIYNACGALTLLNSTVSYNISESAWGGGGILMWGFSCAPGMPTANISFSTIFENSNVGWGRGNAIGIAPNYSNPGSVVLKNSILASPSHPSEAVCNNGAYNDILFSLGHNILGDDADVFGSRCPAALTAPGDLINTNPMLEPIANNGGLTPTDVPAVNSPAINAVPPGYCSDVWGNPVTTDQRGVARPQGAGCDIGSVELQLDSTPPVVTANVTGTLGNNGWYTSAVSVSWSVTDPESGIASRTGCDPVSLSADTAGITLTCSATNGAGLSASASLTVKIDKAAPTITGTRVPAPNNAGWNNTDVTVSFACADALSGVSFVSPISAVLAGDGANQPVVGTCEDKAGNGAMAIVGGINIDKTKPTTANVAAIPNPVAVNVPITLSAGLSDLGGSNLAAAEYSVNGAAPSQLSAAAGPSAQVSGALPPFAVTGVYNICVHARDVAGNTGADECLFLPVYDPNGGFVTGGGWINSPPGAYTADPLLTGKATFGFESRYQRGATVPSGDTQFQFRVANLNFKSTSYAWLVISGSRAQYKGSGTINGAGNYDFLLTAIDGDVAGGGGTDRFRIKIWSSDGVVYDNQPSSDDNADPTTALGGGSVVIHAH